MFADFVELSDHFCWNSKVLGSKNWFLRLKTGSSMAPANSVFTPLSFPTQKDLAEARPQPGRTRKSRYHPKTCLHVTANQKGPTL
jgi:hypothetical protein